jgi:hypothetical protein
MQETQSTRFAHIEITRSALKKGLLPNDTSAAAAAAVSLLEALMRLMNERGLLAPGDLDELLVGAKEGTADAVRRIIDAAGESVRSSKRD